MEEIDLIDLVKNIAELNTSMKYIQSAIEELKKDMKELKDNKPSCSDCEVKRALDKHIDEGTDNKKFWISTVLSILAIIAAVVIGILRL
jgi:hypothetical protein